MNNIYQDNKYTKTYYRIVVLAQSRQTPPNTESHHIIPASFYKNHKRAGQSPGWIAGDPDACDNLVNLTIREHRLCHILLCKMTTGTAQAKMARAAKWIMDSSSSTRGISKGRCYEQIKLLALTANSVRHKGKTRSPEEIAKQRRSRELTGANNFSPEHRAKLSEAAGNRVKSPEEIAKFKITMSQRAHKRSEESNRKMLATRASKGPEYQQAIVAKNLASRERNKQRRLADTYKLVKGYYPEWYKDSTHNIQ